MPTRTLTSPAYILVAAPRAILPLYAGSHDAFAPLRCVEGARDALHCLNEELVAAVLCHETPALDPEMIRALAAWYHARGGRAPLLAVVTDLAQPGIEEHPLYQLAALLFSRYHSRPDEIISYMRKGAFPEKEKKKRKNKI